ncbi:non-ribosomal peptide synthetase, partial [Bacillus pseudomycoides]
HSLKAMKLISLIHQKFQVNILLREIFKNPILCDMSKIIRSKDENLYNAIEIVNKREFYPASSAQIRMYVTQQLDRDSVAYNMPIAFRFTGVLNIKNVEQAFRVLMHRHESLRTSFRLVEGQVVQQVHEELEWSLEVKCIEENSINDYIEKFVRPFDLASAPLIRVNLLKLSETEHIFLLDTHHIISDGTSLTILLREFIELYEGRSIKSPQIQYKDYAVWQRKQLQSENLKLQEKYWLSTMSGELPVLELPTDFLRPPVRSFTGDKVKVSLSEKWMNHLSLLNQKQGSTLFMTLCACYNILLSKYSGQEDVIIGTINNGRKHGDLEGIIGMFVNMLALRNYPKPNMNFYDFLESVKENVLSAFENQDYPFEDMVEKLAVRYSHGENPIFNTMFSLQNLDMQHISTKKLGVSSYNYNHRISKFDLTLEAFEYKGELFLEFEYATHLFERSTIERMAGHFIQILKQIIKKPDIKLSNIQMLGQEEKQLILGFNDKVSDYQKTTISAAFEEQVKKTPSAKAVVYDGESLTYEQLNEKANQLAHILREKGVQTQQVVGLLATRSIEMLIGQIAILKAGGIYLPIDPSFPENRIEYMLQDSGVNILLTNVSVNESLDFKREIIFINNATLYQGIGENLVNRGKPNDLAYIIYTSGSTGKPKGVMIEHHSVLNLSNWFCQKYDLVTNCNVLQMTNISFDVSIEETLVTLLNGATIYIPKKEIILSSNQFVQYLKENYINIAQFVPITLQELLGKHERLEDLHVVICGGEKLEKSLAKQILDKGYQLFNHYGPTEATVDTLVYDCQIDSRKVLLGKSINNTRVYVLDKGGCQLQPIGVPGELCIAGAGVARGYLGKSDMNAIKFVSNPFVPEEKMYRTGDWVRWLPNGNIEYLGRIDDQVKIRGHRIELGEIEGNLLLHPFVNEAVVIARQDEDKQSYLCAYLVMEKEYKASRLREDLMEKLPNYMIPAYFVFLERLPQLENGKINRKALPLPEYDLSSAEEYEAPSTPLEHILSVMWAEILNVQNPGVNANFFEIGGHSLKATFLASRIYKEVGIEVPIRVLFSRPTIKELATYISENKPESYKAIQPIEERAYYPASSAQKRLYIMNQLEKASTNYNMSLFMRINGKLNISQFCDVVDSLVQRHEILRTTFELVDEELVQRINENINIDVSIQDANEQELSELALGFIQPFDLQEGPLIRVALIKMNDEQYVLMLDMHHIVSDGISINILLNELFKLYKGEPLELLELQYKDFASWEQEWKNSDNFQQQEQYWIEMFSNDVPVMNMPTDYPRPPVRKFEGSQVSFEINEELTQKLYALSVKYGTTLYINLLAMYNILLSKYTGQEDIVIGSPIAGRVHTEFESIVGMFVNTLALRNYPEPKLQFNVFLLQVKEVVLKSIENQSYPFEGLVEKLDMERDLSRNPLFDTMFVMQNTGDKTPEIDMQDIALSPYEYENKTARFDLTLSVTEFEGKIIGSMEYSSHLFRESTITRMTQNFIGIIEQLVHQTDTTIADLEVVTESEKKLLVNEFNDSEVLFQNDVTLQGLFEQQVKRSPEQVALIFGSDEITYEQLNTKANGLARTLRKKGIKPETMVGIMMEPSIEMGIGLLAILKAGGAYVPIDPHYPEGRIQHIIQDSQVNIIITQTHIKNCVEFTGEWLDVLDEKNYDIHSENLIFEQETDSLAYVIYTSGTTGNPKGTLIEHKSIVNMLQWRCLEYKFSTEHRILQLLSYAFDAFVANFFTPLLCGATVVLLKENEMKDLITIKETIVSKKIAHFACVPSLYGALLEILDPRDVRSLQSITLGGDKLSEKIRSLSYEKAPHIEIVNEYGPTENSVTTTISRNVQLADHIRIGCPISNVHAYVLNPEQHLQPIGVPGELYIGGAGLARGYLNKPDLTAERFLSIPSLPDHRLYRTGDIVRLHEDGQIEFLGRVDNQIKVRGYRIETDEIEAALLQLETIQEVVVTLTGHLSDEKVLCAYFVSKEELVERELRDTLSKVLPFYMIPSYFMQIEKMPLTLNNKIDKKALPRPRKNDIEEKVLIKPVNKIEEILLTIWSEVLCIEKVGTNDSFFELGGDSIKAIKIVARLNNYDLDLEMKDIFQHPTIQELAPYVQQKKIEINQDMVIGKVNLAPVQHWFFEKEFTDQHHWNQSMILHHIEGFKASLVEKVFSKVVEHHDALRIIFKIEDGQICQVNRGLEETIFEMEEYDLTAKFDVAPYIQKISNRIQESLDIYRGPLIKLGLFKTRTGDHLLIVIHHLIVDTVSWRILIEDFIKGYQQAEEQKRIVLQPKTHSFQEWSNELVHYRKNKADEYEAYWRSIDSNDVKPLPKDYVAFDNLFKDTYTITESLSKEWTDNLLKRTNNAYSTEIDDVLLTALGLTVQEWTGEHKVALHMEGHGRESIREGINLSRTVGWFTSIYPVVLEINPAEDISYQIRSVKENLRCIPNKGIDYGILRYTGNSKVDERKLKLKPEISYNYLGQLETQETESTIRASSFSMGETMSPRTERLYTLEVSAVIVQGQFTFNFSYNKYQYDEKTIMKLVQLFKQNLFTLIEHCMSKKKTVLTPSDVGDKDLSLDELGDIINLIDSL